MDWKELKDFDEKFAKINIRKREGTFGGSVVEVLYGAKDADGNPVMPREDAEDGHGRWFVSFHAEVDGAVDVFYTHDVIDNIEKRIREELSAVCTIHMDPIVTDDEKVAGMRQKVVSIVKTFDERMDIHDFRYVYGVTHSNLIFDISVPFEIKMSDEDIKEKVSKLIRTLDESFFAVIEIDRC